ncbi:glyoxylase-like metal-dependent hydrolase (beta-lactamase superfamily II) [Kordia periserrulae]|uniref:Glyoxylase-like metal-dependent hydrolase (Beta-lactamase superfamily II) n=1 Tax=Kordia periserrulae TaxID=701523 RepID=A0A2T6BUK7_9FLAO|nr:MBL fold metallo-hydrolase [Kordia periserrulae]PTX59760.1 glyoxylase-like metal-dependent hydrolase (beta-lactamase superfamily II) [Kordia periserrulae]
MNVEQIYTGCIAHAAYYIESNGVAAVFDPLREVQPYIDRATEDNATIKYVFETHFHADFVSGHLDLQKKAGAEIVFGPGAKPAYEAITATDGQVFEVGDYKVKVIHTPGHTMESTTYLLIDENGKEHGIITGDTLFIGDVGRPDLAQHVIADLTEEKLAGHLYDSLRNKILPLSDDLIVYPNHGAGSACGKKMSKETTDTLGNQKKVNYALQDMTKDEFIKVLLDGLTTPPGYFPQNVLMNIKGYESLDTIMDRAKQALTPNEFEVVANETGALLLDTRDASDFAKGFIPNSINIGLEGNFAQWVGEMIPDVKQEILLITYPGKEEEAITRLSRVGYDFTIGYLKDGFDSWKKNGKEVDSLQRISATDLEQQYKNKDVKIFDVRKKSEFDSEHVIDAINVPLNEINKHLAEFPKDEPFIIHCAGGYRSMIAASILKQRGWDNFVDVVGGFKEIAETSVDTSEYVCPTTLL